MTKTGFIIVAIDGGAASGKSSTARGVGARLGLLHVDTGSHYRFLTHHLLIAGAHPDDAASIERALSRLSLGSRIRDGASQITIGGEEPGPEIRSEEVNRNVSRFAAVPAVRRFLMDYQRSQADLARRAGLPGIVMEGRDIGTVIFPDADVKIFLTADPAARAKRRAAEGQTDSIHQRDQADAARATAPLARPENATVIDSTSLSLEQVVDTVCQLIRGVQP
jgi:cytidylate kinase